MTKKAVLIGAGMVAPTHVAAFRDARGAALAGVYSRTRARAEEVAKQAGVPVYDSLEAVAADPDVDFAAILTPPDARVDVLRPLVDAGKPILLEKPVARTAAEAREVVNLCRAAGVPLGIVHHHRFREPLGKIRELIATGELGALGLAEIAAPWWRPQSYYDEPGRGTYARDGGGVLITQAIHTVDLALAITGPVARVRAMAATTRFHQMEAEDFVTAGLEFRNGAVGSLTASTASYPGGAHSLAFHYDNASLRLGSGQLVVDWRDGRHEVFGSSADAAGGGADPMAFSHAGHQGVIEDFAAALVEGREPEITGEQAVQMHEFIDAVFRTAKSGAPEDVPQ